MLDTTRVAVLCCMLVYGCGGDPFTLQSEALGITDDGGSAGTTDGGDESETQRDGSAFTVDASDALPPRDAMVIDSAATDAGLDGTTPPGPDAEPPPGPDAGVPAVNCCFDPYDGGNAYCLAYHQVACTWQDAGCGPVGSRCVGFPDNGGCPGIARVTCP